MVLDVIRKLSVVQYSHSKIHIAPAVHLHRGIICFLMKARSLSLLLGF